MLPIILLPLLLCVFNIYRRLTCVVKAKFTKFTFFTLLIVLVVMLSLGYKFRNDLSSYVVIMSWWLAFFTSIMSAGITEKGLVHPWQLIAKLYKWEKIRTFSIEKRENTVMVNFKAIRDLRQEYDKSDLEKIKKIAKQNKLI
ncbi:hypothetical protein [Parvimonas parva]|uniref:hypothetical protein n=1 Tax=Parvimonas parva TaxID=2769485 RepID=UPI0038B3CACF